MFGGGFYISGSCLLHFLLFQHYEYLIPLVGLIETFDHWRWKVKVSVGFWVSCTTLFFSFLLLLLWVVLAELSEVILGYFVASSRERMSSSPSRGGFWCTVSEWVHCLLQWTRTFEWITEYCSLQLCHCLFAAGSHASLLQKGNTYSSSSPVFYVFLPLNTKTTNFSCDHFIVWV